MVVRIDKEKCSGCAYCVLICPNDALSAYGIAKLDVDKCTECKLCIPVCPNESISEEE